MLPSEKSELALYRFVESAGRSQWRPTTLSALGLATGNPERAVVVDMLTRLQSQDLILLRKWVTDKFRAYPDPDLDDAFFYRDTFEIKTAPRGRPYFERLEEEEKQLKGSSSSGSAQPAISSLPSNELKPFRLLRVFLCHSSTDKPAVRDLCRKLRTEGLDPWLDEEKLHPGQDWELEITKAVRASDVVLVCLSPTSVPKTGYVQKEIKLALDVADEQPEGSIFLIPVKLEDCDRPERLRRWQWVNLFEERGYEKLVRALRTRAADLGVTLAAIPPVVLPSYPAFPAAESKDGPARFRAAGEPLGMSWDPLLLAAGAERDIFVSSGPAMWLRLMPATDPGKRWPPHELKLHAIHTSSLYLAPFIRSNLYFLRAEDGFGIYSLTTPGAAETNSVAFAFETGEIWSVDTALLAARPAYRRFVAEVVGRLNARAAELFFIEGLYTERLQDYSRFLQNLGVQPPYRWIGGLASVKRRRLQIPPPSNHMSLPTPGPLYSADIITTEGSYDCQQTPTAALRPFFNLIFHKCDTPRPDYQIC